ncbi:MAG: hypothetical protein KDE58_01550, partial [Caldilineaceae bacterium]|nr:hypothetical protein [Caldilineaceae bacterium]
PKHYERGPGFNVVYAEALSEQGILRGLAVGHSYLSVGPVLHLQAETAGGDTAMMGDLLPTAAHTDFMVTSNWSAAPTGATLRLIVNAAIYAKAEVAAEGRQEWRVPVHGTHWCTVELRAANGSMLAITNPVFLSRA